MNVNDEEENSDLEYFLPELNTETASYRPKRGFVHISVDVDGAASLAIVKICSEKFSDLVPVFVPVNWDGKEWDGLPFDPEYDIAVDIEAGGKGIKGYKENTGNGSRNVHSAFAEVVEIFASQEEKEALQGLVGYIDAHDTYGNALTFLDASINGFWHREYMFAGSLVSVFKGLQAHYGGDDKKLFERMFEFLSGYLKNQLSYIRARKIIAEKRFPTWGTNDNRVALVIEPEEWGIPLILLEKGFKAVVTINKNNFRIDRGKNTEVSLDDRRIRELIPENEKGEWFFHQSGGMVSRGGGKVTYPNQTFIDPESLVHSLVELFTEGN